MGQPIDFQPVFLLIQCRLKEAGRNSWKVDELEATVAELQEVRACMCVFVHELDATSDKLKDAQSRQQDMGSIQSDELDDAQSRPEQQQHRHYHHNAKLDLHLLEYTQELNAKSDELKEAQGRLMQQQQQEPEQDMGKRVEDLEKQVEDMEQQVQQLQEKVRVF
eukprot:1159989-Pelagomonas_calceolata.AAC.16